MYFFSRIGEILKNPKNYFNKVQKEGFWEPFWFYFLWTVVLTLFSSFFLAITWKISFYWLFLIYPLYVLFSLFALGATAGITHLSLKIFGGQGKFTETVKTIVYGDVPYFLWGIPAGILQIIFSSNIIIIMLLLIPGLGLMVYALYLKVVGAAILHKIDRWKAFWGLILPIAVLTGILMIIIMFVGVVLIAASRG